MFGNIDAVIYGLIASFVSTQVIDRLIYGVGAGKVALGVTEAAPRVVAAVSASVDRGCTVLEGSGGYSGELRRVVMCACSKRQLPILRKAVSAADRGAFIIVLESSEVFGEGFLPPQS